MSKLSRVELIAVIGVIWLGLGGVPFAQSGLPNPYRPVKGLADGGGPSVPGGDWARLPGGREMGPPASVHVDADGESIWAFIRCDETSPLPVAAGGRFGLDCLGPDNKIKNMDTIFKFDPKGNVIKSFGAGMFIWPHGLYVDREGNVWVTDAVGEQGVALAAKAGVRAGHQIFKFSPDGKLLMTLGEAGVPGDDQYHFRSPSAVAVAANGDIFVADGHEVNGNNRVVKYTQRRKIRQGVGEDRLRTRRVPVAACHRHRYQRPRVRRRPGEQPDPAFRSGWEVPADLDAVRDTERDLLR